MEHDLHYEMILDEYREKQPLFERIKSLALNKIQACLNENHILIAGLESRIKTEKSLSGKLERKGYKYHSIADITDVLGLRVVTYYSNEVDLISAHLEQLFDIDWDNSVDKRKMLETDRLGYMSLHYICRIPESMCKDLDMPELNQMRFELQIRSLLQHAWANLYHDMGYKNDVEIPVEYQRDMNLLAGMLELADAQFTRIRKEINDYRRNVQSLVATGNFNEVPLNGDTFRTYLELKPYLSLAEKIVGVKQAKLYEDSLEPYYPVLRRMGMKTIGDLERLRNTYSEGAFQLVLIQMTGTDCDNMAYSMVLQNICIVAILKQGFGEAGVIRLLAGLYGESQHNVQLARTIYEQAQKINLI
jgi:ppGpp synthetase/RelA/SpoT-type nucleotidyltranferase